MKCAALSNRVEPHWSSWRVLPEGLTRLAESCDERPRHERAFLIASCDSLGRQAPGAAAQPAGGMWARVNVTLDTKPALGKVVFNPGKMFTRAGRLGETNSSADGGSSVVRSRTVEVRPPGAERGGATVKPRPAAWVGKPPPTALLRPTMRRSTETPLRGKCQSPGTTAQPIRAIPRHPWFPSLLRVLRASAVEPVRAFFACFAVPPRPPKIPVNFILPRIPGFRYQSRHNDDLWLNGIQHRPRRLRSRSRPRVSPPDRARLWAKPSSASS